MVPPFQGGIQSKFEGGAVGSGGAETFSEIGDECKPYITISDPNYVSRLSIHFVRKFSQ